jgi:hypothetical protein
LEIDPEGSQSPACTLEPVEKKKCCHIFLAQGSKSLAATQFCHTAGILVVIITGLCHGVTCVIPAPTFDARKMLEGLIHER